MQDFNNKIAVITGGGSGIGRALAQALSAQGCHVAICDLSAENMQQTQALCEQNMPAGIRLSHHLCDVSDATAVAAFAAEVQQQHNSKHVNLVFNNAGVSGGGSFIKSDAAEWQKTFDICWGGVYNGSRAFLPLLIASDEGHLVNVSSINGTWASMGPHIPHTAYSAAKFAVKGFTEALITDLQANAPHVKTSVVMPGHIGTSIALNTRLMHSEDQSLALDAVEIAEMRDTLSAMLPDAGELDDATIQQLVEDRLHQFRDSAPTTAEQAAQIILDGVRANRWRILVGEDAVIMDEMIRQNPESAYSFEFFAEMGERGVFGGIAS